MNIDKKICPFAILVCFYLQITYGSLYSRKSYITPINKINFENQINKIKQTTKLVSIVHYYKKDGI